MWWLRNRTKYCTNSHAAYINVCVSIKNPPYDTHQYLTNKQAKYFSQRLRMQAVPCCCLVILEKPHCHHSSKRSTRPVLICKSRVLWRLVSISNQNHFCTCALVMAQHHAVLENRKVVFLDLKTVLVSLEISLLQPGGLNLILYFLHLCLAS